MEWDKGVKPKCRSCEAMEWAERMGPDGVGHYIAVRAVYGHSCGEQERVKGKEKEMRERDETRGVV